MTGLMSYKYSIVIENCVEKDYFTENLLTASKQMWFQYIGVVQISRVILILVG